MSHSVSLSTDHELFPRGGLSVHDLKDLDGLRAVQRTIKNILDWGQGERLQMVRIERAAAERVAAAASKSSSVGSEPPKVQKQRRRKCSPTVTTTTPSAQNEPATKRAPAPPKPLQSARALYDFIPEPEDEPSGPGFKKSDTIEFADAVAGENGWLRGRIKGGI
ncbi:hypothetical protein FGG08_004788 [Glutinoglossum americanum]|uniref:Uncharacterized protein n=1 Tax=Glutinoglossum americanum TaxID=1670608 RepID=A0A9P8L253_9PEZI|nr:hypothetical protein FGG08_004788 [Glutinoglossum americanum]